MAIKRRNDETSFIYLFLFIYLTVCFYLFIYLFIYLERFKSNI